MVSSRHRLLLWLIGSVLVATCIAGLPIFVGARKHPPSSPEPSPPPSRLEDLACALQDGPEGREARLARLRADVESAVAAADSPRKLARILEVLRRIEPLRLPSQRLFAELRDVARDVVEASGAAPPGARERLAQVELHWPEADDFVHDPAGSRARSFVRGCDATLLADEGWVSKDRRAVVVCPGFLLLEFERARKNTDEGVDAAAFLLAHELGHVIDDAADDPFSERSADRWASAILDELARRRDEQGGDAGRLVARALGSFCDLPPGDPLHGDGRERAVAAARRLRSLGAARVPAPSRS